MKRLFFAAVISLLCVGTAAKSGYKPRVEDLSVEGQAMPRFSWRIASTAPDVVQEGYRIIVSSSRRNLRKGKGDIWDSGVVESPESRFIPYVGEPLESRTKALWRVLSYTNKGVAKSKPACLEVALNDATCWQASTELQTAFERASQWMQQHYDERIELTATERQERTDLYAAMTAWEEQVRESGDALNRTLDDPVKLGWTRDIADWYKQGSVINEVYVNFS